MRKKVPDVGVCALLLLYKRTVIRAVGTGRRKEKRAISPPGSEQNIGQIPFRVLIQIHPRNQLLNVHEALSLNGIHGIIATSPRPPTKFLYLPAPLVKRCSRIVSTLTDAQESTLATPQSIL